MPVIVLLIHGVLDLCGFFRVNTTLYVSFHSSLHLYTFKKLHRGKWHLSPYKFLFPDTASSGSKMACAQNAFERYWRNLSILDFLVIWSRTPRVAADRRGSPPPRHNTVSISFHNTVADVSRESTFLWFWIFRANRRESKTQLDQVPRTHSKGNILFVYPMSSSFESYLRVVPTRVEQGWDVTGKSNVDSM